MTISIVALGKLLRKDARRFRQTHQSPWLIWQEPSVKSAAGEFVPQATTGQARYSKPRVAVPLVFEVKKSQDQVDRLSFITLGRAVTNDITLDHKSVSRLHAFFAEDEKTGRFRVSDSQSRNGTFVDEVRVEPGSWALVHDRSKVKIGSVELVFMLPATFLAELEKQTP